MVDVDFMEEHCNEQCGQISLNWNMMTVSNETKYRPIPTLIRRCMGYDQGHCEAFVCG